MPLAASLASVLLVGCGSSSDPVGSTSRTTAQVPRYSVAVTDPASGHRFVSGRATLAGTANPSSTMVRVEVVPPRGKEFVRKVRARGGLWSLRLPRLRDGVATFYISTGPGHGDALGDGFVMFGVRLGVSPAVKARRVAARRARARTLLLGRQRAVGLSVAQVRKALGPPSHQQRIAGQRFMYYQYNGNLVQLVFAGDVVTQVNAY
jgi:hypothetical protein